MLKRSGLQFYCKNKFKNLWANIVMCDKSSKHWNSTSMVVQEIAGIENMSDQAENFVFTVFWPTENDTIKKFEYFH